MTEPISTVAAAPSRPRGEGGDPATTIDLRFPDAQWTYRQLQARVSHARDLLARAEAGAEARATTAQGPVEEADDNEALLAAQDLIAREWAETAATSSTRLAAADAEVVRITETAQAEARALRAEAEFLRSPRADESGLTRSRGAAGVTVVETGRADGETSC